MSEIGKGHIVVVGGGVTGCVAAGSLARSGYSVSIIEKEKITGGMINRWFQLFPDRRNGDEVREYVSRSIDHPNIKIITGAKVTGLKKEEGKYIVFTESDPPEPADAVIVATGFDLFDAHRKEEYGYGIYDNVITSTDLEEMFHSGAIETFSGSPPGRIGIVHCVGSRDEKVSNFHCSKVCCVTAVKQAIEIKEHLPDCEVYCFYMDMRMFGPYYEELYRESQEKFGVNYIRGKVSEANEKLDGKIMIKAEDTLSGRPLRMEVDLLVLMVGMENSKDGIELAKNSPVEIGLNGFFKIEDNHYRSNGSYSDGLFLAGACTAPMNITDAISHARAAVVETEEYLKTRKKQ